MARGGERKTRETKREKRQRGHTNLRGSDRVRINGLSRSARKEQDS